MDVSLTLESLVPAAEYSGSLTKNTESQYNALIWRDERPKPSWSSIVSAWPNLPPPAPSPDDTLDDAIRGASNFQELKTALLGRTRGRKL